MKRFLQITVWSWLMLMGWNSSAQQSMNVVDFLLTYDAGTTRYTAWVVPRYSLPNDNNAGTVEKGGTAQFTIKVPAAFTITNIMDIKGQWEKAPLRLGPGNPGQDWSGSGLDPAINYYVIGKSPSESSYGAFVSGVPVALFTFQGNGCLGPLGALEPGNRFITQADQRYSLNVANSFYSLSGTPTGGNQTPREQFQTVTGNPAQCAVLAANPDSQTLTAGVAATIPVLANDINNGQPATTASVTVTVSTPPATGTATVNSDGTIRFTPATGFTGPVSFTYTICSIAQPTVCSSTSVSLTVNPVPTQFADLLITKRVSQPTSATGDVVSFTVTVQNMGPASALGVSVTDTILRSNSVQIQGAAIPSRGSFNPATGIWTVGDLAASETATLVLSVRILTQGVVVNIASVTATGSLDPDGTNNTASACTSVPYTLCSGESLTVSVPQEYPDVRWYRNGDPTPVKTGNSVTLDLPGTYTVSSSSGACPIAGCCPIVIQQGDCCPVDKCVPFVIRKTKSHL